MMLLAVFLGLLTCNKSESARASPSQRQRTKPLQGLAAQRCRAAEPATTEEEEEEERSHVDRDLPFFDVFPDSRIPQGRRDENPIRCYSRGLGGGVWHGGECQGYTCKVYYKLNQTSLCGLIVRVCVCVCVCVCVHSLRWVRGKGLLGSCFMI
jgi:hypothetical protein